VNSFENNGGKKWFLDKGPTHMKQIPLHESAQENKSNYANGAKN
jgi:hypothetical protein